ncbi:MAG: PQQ-binding-like beta-propeller repeat protein [Gemmataceae bacterium]
MIRLAWSRALAFSAAGLCLAREPAHPLVWCSDGRLARLDHGGQALAEFRLPYPLQLAAISDDGRTVLTAGTGGQVALYTLDFVPVWKTTVSRRPVAVALDHLGARAAVADDGGGLHIFDDRGQRVWQAATPRPLVHLAFVPEEAVLLGAAEYGLVCAFDARGDTLWRDGLVAHVGGLAVTGTGDRAVLACFTQGLFAYHPRRGGRTAIERASPARLVAVSYRGDRLVTAGLNADLAIRDPAGDVLAAHTLPAIPSAMALDGLGEFLYALLADGRLVGVELSRHADGRK